MDFLNKNKVTIGGAVGLALLGYVYFAYFGSSSAPLTTSVADGAISGDLLLTLNSLYTIKLDNTIFANPVFLSLSDFGTPPAPQDAGRPNPFAPLGSRVGTSTTTTNQ